MSDIVERLRIVDFNTPKRYPVISDAADEIERLRAALERIADEPQECHGCRAQPIARAALSSTERPAVQPAENHMSSNHALAKYLARELFKCGSEPCYPASRIEFKHGPLGSERGQGGFGERPLVNFFERILDDWHTDQTTEGQGK